MGVKKREFIELMDVVEGLDNRVDDLEVWRRYGEPLDGHDPEEDSPVGVYLCLGLVGVVLAFQAGYKQGREEGFQEATDTILVAAVEGHKDAIRECSKCSVSSES